MVLEKKKKKITYIKELMINQYNYNAFVKKSNLLMPISQLDIVLNLKEYLIQQLPNLIVQLFQKNQGIN